MMLHERSLRPWFDTCLARWCAAFLVSIFVVAATESVEASIVGPKVPEFSLETSVSGASSKSTSQSAAPTRQPASEESAQELEFTLLSAQQGPSSTSSTSGSPSVIGANSSIAGICFPARILSDPAVAGWVSGERRVSLPPLRCNELLRPPQKVMCF